MLVFIDDSGDTGFKAQSSQFFIIALVIFDDNLVAEETSLAIKKLRREFKFPDTMEFKFHKSRLQVKKRFLEVVAKYPFRVRAIVVEKGRVRGKFKAAGRESFFNHVVMTVFRETNGTIKNAKLHFDKRGEKRVRNELRAYLSRELDNKAKNVFKDLKFIDSKKDTLVQLADMIAGTIGSYNKGSNKELFLIIKKRIENIVEYS
jgi:hypothetical protein